MSAVGDTAVQAQAGIADLESALEKTQSALSSVENLDQVAARAARKGSRLVKLLLIATVVGVAVLVAKKVIGGSGTVPVSTDPFGANSTDG